MFKTSNPIFQQDSILKPADRAIDRAQVDTVMRLVTMNLTPDDKRSIPRGPRLSSFNARVLDLAPGESTSKMRQVDPTTTVERLAPELPMLREQVRNSTTPAVTNARKHHANAKYSIEVGDLLMPSGRLFVVAVVTREA